MHSRKHDQKKKNGFIFILKLHCGAYNLLTNDIYKLGKKDQARDREIKRKVHGCRKEVIKQKNKYSQKESGKENEMLRF